jgi:hypothetical protein
VIRKKVEDGRWSGKVETRIENEISLKETAFLGWG